MDDHALKTDDRTAAKTRSNASAVLPETAKSREGDR